MKSISILSLTFLSVCICLVTAKVEKPATNTATNLIEKACASSTKKPLCLSVLNAKPNAKTTNLEGLAFIAFTEAKDTAVNTSVSVKSLLNKGEFDDSELDDGLHNCADAYVDAVDQIEEAVDALLSEEFEDVNNYMKAAIADIEICDENMQGLSAPEAKDLLEKNRHVRDLCTNALELAHVSSHDTN